MHDAERFTDSSRLDLIISLSFFYIRVTSHTRCNIGMCIVNGILDSSKKCTKRTRKEDLIQIHPR